MFAVYKSDSRARIFASLFLAVFILVAAVAQAAPKDVYNYQVYEGGLVDIQNGAYIEGSIRHGGIQPDYKIDLESEPLKSFLLKAERIGQLPISFWDKVGMILDLTQTDFFKYTDYYNPYYRRLLKKYRDSFRDVPLSEYGVCGAGVCREHALVLHFALKAAGIENKHAYAKIYRASRYYKYQVVEDHAFNVVKHRGVEWVVDAYYWGFNGFKLKDLMSPEGITEKSAAAPIATPARGTRSILEINAFPKIYNPVISNQCAKIFL